MHVSLLHRMLEDSVVREESDHCSPLSFTVELRPQATDDDTGYTGFMVPTEQVYIHTGTVGGLCELVFL